MPPKTARQSSTISFYFVFAPSGTGLEQVTEAIGEASSHFLGSGIDLLDRFLELGSGFAELAESLARLLQSGMIIADDIAHVNKLFAKLNDR